MKKFFERKGVFGQFQFAKVNESKKIEEFYFT